MKTHSFVALTFLAGIANELAQDTLLGVGQPLS
jgi:hypothetical protein